MNDDIDGTNLPALGEHRLRHILSVIDIACTEALVAKHMYVKKRAKHMYVKKRTKRKYVKNMQDPTLIFSEEKTTTVLVILLHILPDWLEGCNFGRGHPNT